MMLIVVLYVSTNVYCIVVLYDSSSSDSSRAIVAAAMFIRLDFVLSFVEK